MTLHVSDILADILRRDTSGIRDAFRAVAGYPKEDEIVGATPDELIRLLGQLAEAVSRDHGQMPGDFAEALRERFDGCAAELMPHGTYAEGGAAVRRHLVIHPRTLREIMRQAAAN